MGTIFDENDSLLLSNPKLLETQPDSAFSRICSFDESLLYSSGYFSSRNEVISCVISMINGVDLMSQLPVMYLYKNDFNLSPAMLIFLCGVTRLPLSIKILFAFMSDSIPIFGSRRRIYLAIGSITVLISMLLLGISGDQGVIATTIYLTMSYLGITICNVVGEALVIESGRTQSNDQVTRSMSTFCAFRKLTFAALLYLGAVLMMIVPTRKVFLIASVLPIIVFLVTPFIQEREITVFPSLQNQWSRLVNFACMPEVRKPATFLFITMVAPSAGTAMFYFMTEKLHFNPELFGRLSAFQAMAGLVGIYCYARFFKRANVRRLFVCATFLVSFFCILGIVLVKRWNIQMGIPDTAFAITDNSMLEFVSEIYSIPIFVTSIRLCPQGIESSMYSLLWTVQLMGLNVSTYLSAIFTHVFGVDKGNFDGLVPLIFLCSILHLLPIFFIWMIPEGVPEDTIGDQSELDSCLSHDYTQEDMKESEHKLS